MLISLTLLVAMEALSGEPAANQPPRGAAAMAGTTNRWVRISDGALPTVQDLRNKYPKRIYAKPVLDPQTGKALAWCNLGGGPGRYYTFDAVAGRWDEVHAAFLPQQNFELHIKGNPLAFCRLPKTGKFLAIYPNNRQFSKPHATTWLLDPVSNRWDVESTVVLTDSSGKFNPTPMYDGYPAPFWGDLIYDPVNEEAVAFGGAGVWGRVTPDKEKVRAYDWIYDETMEPKRMRRLTEKDGTIEARRWYPAHTGTWTFSEATRKWTPTEQPMREQPPGRILSQMAYDEGAKKIVLFGGDDRSRVMNDTWVYDCATRRWSEAKPKVSPPPRAAHALVYLPDQGVILLAGGYTAGWQKLKDVWIYRLKDNEWARLATDLPEATQYCSGYYDPKLGAPVVAAALGIMNNSAWPAFAIRLDAAAPRLAPGPTLARGATYHCGVGVWYGRMPEDWLAGKLAPEDPAQVRERLKAMTANRWVNPKPPAAPIERTWGSYVYDPRTHRVYAYGGGHSGYPGSDFSEYDVLLNRWRNQADPTEYYPRWLAGMSQGLSGISIYGNTVLPSHARKAYGVDPASDSVILWVGDVYNTRERRVLASIGVNPDWQPACVTAAGRLYAYANGGRARRLYVADVKGGKWEAVPAEGGPAGGESAHLSFDSKRGRIIYMDGGAIWAFDLEKKTWAREAVVGGLPPALHGDSTYVAGMDAVLLVFATAKGGPEKLYFYKLAERRWYSAPSLSDDPKESSGSNTGLDHSPHYDPELGVLVRIYPRRFGSPLEVRLMRLVPEDLKLAPLPEPPTPATKIGP